MTESEPPTSARDKEGSEFIQNSIQVAVGATVLGGLVFFVLFAISEWNNTAAWSKVEFGHFAATIGLPLSAVGAFVVCTLLRTAEGKIRFSAPGFKFEGASGPIVMWVFCFLAIAAAIRLLWPLSL